MSRAVEVEFLAAAAARWGGAWEEFLWRCRRCLEAMLYALLLGKGAKVQASAKGPKTLDELLKHDALEELMPREMRDHAESVRKYGNTGTHFQVDGDVSEASASITASAFAEVLRWYFTRDDADFPAELQRAQRALTDPQWRIPSPLESALDQERARTASLQRQVHARPTPVAAPVDAPRAPLAPWGIGLCAALFTGALGYALGGSAAAPPDPRAGEPSAPPTVTTAGTIEPTPVPPPSAPLPAAAPTPAAPTPDASASAPAVGVAPAACPPAMFRVADDRGAAVCIGIAAVTAGDYLACVGAHGCEPPANSPGCHATPHGDAVGLAANCVTRAQALAYCRYRLGSRAGLPLKEEWGRARIHRDAVRLLPRTNEWAEDDASPGRAWVRGPWADGRLTWEEQRPDVRADNLSFRCVMR
ncbi:MAG: DUF4145 domain-containing protein [Polyangiales bacterium]